ncbi:MAG TPA: hypothetical protein VK148_21010 [Xanthobacteraceae bacterium]|jgi:hypothetical protein|nr:hypothetical protein [Xanthobacteraceae bacterium]
MLKGRFEDATGAPIVEGHVAFPRLDRRGGVFFLVDTGADGTVIMPGDCDKLEIDTGTLVNPTTSRGIGGTSGGFIERVVRSFSDEQYRYVYVLKIEISAPTSFNQGFPSLLGRDVLNRGRCVIDFHRNQVTFAPRTWDLRRKI